MATIKQKLAFKEITENHLPVSKAMLKVGYEPVTASKPANLLNSKGFQEICDESGLTDDFLTKALYDDIKSKPKKREKELRLAFQIKGKLAPSDGGGDTNYTQINIYSPEQERRIAERILNQSKGEDVPNRLSDSDEPEVRTELAP